MKILFNILSHLLILGWISSASAGVVTYSATNVGGPLFSNAWPSHLQTFTVNTDGLYSMQTIAADFDTVIYLYLGMPAIPGDETSEIAFDDDGGRGVLSLIADVSLMADTQYTLLTRGFNGQSGNFGAVIWGIGDISLGDSIPGPVPLPAAAWLFGSALLGLGVIKRRKA